MIGTWVKRGLIVALAAVMILILLQSDWPTADPDPTTNEQVGQQLFGTGADPGFSPVILMIAVLLLVAMMGAVFLAKEEEGHR